MTLLRFARVLKISTNISNPSDDLSHLMCKSREGLYLDHEKLTVLLEQLGGPEVSVTDN